jgi:hypothetical protein
MRSRYWSRELMFPLATDSVINTTLPPYFFWRRLRAAPAS